MTATATDSAGNTSEFSACVSATGGVATESVDELPTEFELEPNYPNPFNPVTNVRYAVPRSGHIRLSVYDIQGREVEVLVDQIQPAGRYSLSFDANRLSSGVYLYRLQSGDFSQSRVLIVLK